MTVGRDHAIERVVDLLRRGGVVAIPTETVYGLAADADNATAVERIFQIKGRPSNHPLIVHLPDRSHIDLWASEVPAAAEVLIEHCWPGPLTVVLRRATRVIDAVTGGRDTVGLRVPAHPQALEILQRFGGGLAAPSANRFGRVSPTTAEHVRADLGSDVDAIVDGGPCPVGVESTIVDCTTEPVQILRSGAITDEQIAALLDGAVGAADGPSRASGMLAAHYAPHAAVLLADDLHEAAVLLARSGAGAVQIGDLDDLARYARHLYRWLRDADEAGATTIVALLPRPQGLGHALRDRLTKAAAARPG